MSNSSRVTRSSFEKPWVIIAFTLRSMSLAGEFSIAWLILPCRSLKKLFISISVLCDRRRRHRRAHLRAHYFRARESDLVRAPGGAARTASFSYFAYQEWGQGLQKQGQPPKPGWHASC